MTNPNKKDSTQVTPPHTPSAPHIHHHIVRHDRDVGRNRQYTTILLYVLFGILFASICIYFLINTATFTMLFEKIGNIAAPILIGFAIAYILNPVLNFCENHMFAGKDEHRYNRARRKLMKAKLLYDSERLAEKPDEAKVEAAQKALSDARTELAESKRLMRAEEERRLEAFYRKQAKKKKKPAFRKEKAEPASHPHRAPALLCTFVVFLSLITVFAALVIPQCISSINDLISLIRYYAETLPARLQTIQLPASITELVNTLNQTVDLKDILLGFGTKAINSVAGILGNLVNKLPQLLSRTISGITNLILGIFMAVYFLSYKEMLLGQVTFFSKAIFGKKTNRFLRRVVRETNRQFGKFIRGKLIDSMLMSVVCFALFSFGGIPYAAMITLITVVTNLIPYFGPFIGAIPSGIIILLAEPRKVIVFIILILIIQQIEGNIIEPRILGSSMGLAPVWIMIAVLIMGELFGIMGMVLGVPIFSVIYTLFGDFCRSRIAKRRAQKSKSAFDQADTGPVD